MGTAGKHQQLEATFKLKAVSAEPAATSNRCALRRPEMSATAATGSPGCSAQSCGISIRRSCPATDAPSMQPWYATLQDAVVSETAQEHD